MGCFSQRTGSTRLRVPSAQRAPCHRHDRPLLLRQRVPVGERLTATADLAGEPDVQRTGLPNAVRLVAHRRGCLLGRSGSARLKQRRHQTPGASLRPVGIEETDSASGEPHAGLVPSVDVPLANPVRVPVDREGVQHTSGDASHQALDRFLAEPEFIGAVRHSKFFADTVFEEGGDALLALRVVA